MGYIQKHHGKLHSKSFARKGDAERFLREVEVDKDRGQWVNPQDAQMLLAEWAGTFLSLCAGSRDHAGDRTARATRCPHRAS